MAKREIPEINAGSMADIAFLLLIFFLVTTTMDKDQAYIRNIPKKVEIVQEQIKVDKRNIFTIRANSRDQLMVREEIMENPDDISKRVVDFYTTNEKKTPEQVFADPSNNFPVYTRISMEKIDEQIANAEAALEEVESNPNSEPTIIEFKEKQLQEWENKKKSLKLYGKNELPEIHFQAHIRIEVQQATSYELFAKIQSELEEAIYEVRDKAALELFNESYGVITRKYLNDPKDMDSKAKLDLLKVLYPDRFIEVRPKG